jgi:hypothetical protein
MLGLTVIKKFWILTLEFLYRLMEKLWTFTYVEKGLNAGRFHCSKKLFFMCFQQQVRSPHLLICSRLVLCTRKCYVINKLKYVTTVLIAENILSYVFLWNVFKIHPSLSSFHHFLICIHAHSLLGMLLLTALINSWYLSEVRLERWWHYEK